MIIASSSDLVWIELEPCKNHNTGYVCVELLNNDSVSGIQNLMHVTCMLLALRPYQVNFLFLGFSGSVFTSFKKKIIFFN